MSKFFQLLNLCFFGKSKKKNDSIVVESVCCVISEKGTFMNRWKTKLHKFLIPWPDSNGTLQVLKELPQVHYLYRVCTGHENLEIHGIW